jgi:hypothetical protein
MKPIFSLPALLVTILATTAQAHSWVELLRLIASNGTFVGTPGYPRGFIPRSAPGWNDPMSEWLVPPDGRSTGTEILSTDMMCKPVQTYGNQTAGFPALTAAPGDNIALIYEENGHVTKLWASPTKPVGSGTVFVYGTKEPSATDTFLGIHRVWNTAGTGGDKRGKLIATRSFDDGQCFQDSTQPLAVARKAEFHPLGNDINCQTDVQLPTDAGTSGTYTLYWVWEWPTLNNVTGAVVSNESYTTCMDINMTPQKLPDAGSFNSAQVADSRAIEAALSTAFLVNPTAAEQLTTTVGVSGAKPTTRPVTSIPATFSAAKSSSTSYAAIGVVTVTVTSQAQKEATVTVTVTASNSLAAPTSSINPVVSSSTISVLPVPVTTSTPTTSQSLLVSSAYGAPSISPFLSARSLSSAASFKIRGGSRS